jgi:hypothetical protein
VTFDDESYLKLPKMPKIDKDAFTVLRKCKNDRVLMKNSRGDLVNVHQKFIQGTNLTALPQTGQDTTAMILCCGGQFTVVVFKDGKVVYNRSDSRYVCRGKQGGR